jgi:hypothetical protein
VLSLGFAASLGACLLTACGHGPDAAASREGGSVREVTELTEAEQRAAAEEMVRVANARVRAAPTQQTRMRERLDEAVSEIEHVEALSREAGREVPPRLRAHLARDLLRDARALIAEDPPAAPAITAVVATRLCASGEGETARTLRLVYEALEPGTMEPCSSENEGREIP